MLRGAQRALGVLAALPVAVVGLAACNDAAVTTQNFGVDVSLPPQPAATSPLAVVVDDGAPASSTTYTLSLVSTTGKVVASVTPKRRSDDVAGCTVTRLPVATASSHRAFFLDGDDRLSWLDVDGKTGSIRSLGNEKGTEVSFSVSPDETRIAVVSVVATAGGFHQEVHVETLGGAGATTPIFTRNASGTGSAGEVSWPVGWHGDGLVMADGAPTPHGGCTGTPDVTGYDLVDPLSGQARLHMCFSTADGVPTGAPAVAGILCAGHDGSGGLGLALESWDGSSTPFGSGPLSCAERGVVAPTGSRAALVAPPCAGAGGTVALQEKRAAPVPTTGRGVPVAWLDGSHVVCVDAGAVSVLDTAANEVRASPNGGRVEAVLPSSL